MFSLFIIGDAPGFALDGSKRAALKMLLAKIPGRGEALVMAADQPGEQPFAHEGPGPALAFQIDFAGKAEAESALAASGALADLPAALNLRPAALSHQLMEAQPFPFNAPAMQDPFCTFLVTYPGTAADLPGWLKHYDAHHPPIMKRFPRIREVATYWPAEFASALPFQRGNAMQRNKVVFETHADLVAALASPVMEEMRADGRGFPASSAKATHFPYQTWRL